MKRISWPLGFELNEATLVELQWRRIPSSLPHREYRVQVVREMGRTGSADLQLTASGSAGFSGITTIRAWVQYEISHRTLYDSGALAGGNLRYCCCFFMLPSTVDGLRDAEMIMSAAIRVVSRQLASDMHHFTGMEDFLTAMRRTHGKVYEQCDLKKRLNRAIECLRQKPEAAWPVRPREIELS